MSKKTIEIQGREKGLIVKRDIEMERERERER